MWQRLCWKCGLDRGISKDFLIDRGTPFMSDVMGEVKRLLSIKSLATTPYHAQCNGLVERFNGTSKSMLKWLSVPSRQVGSVSAGLVVRLP